MKEIKAFVHRGRAADIVHTLLGAGFTELSLTDVKGTLEALSRAEAGYSMEFGESVITEAKIEIVCPDERVEGALEILRTQGHAIRASGWVYVINVERAIRLDAFKPAP